MAHVTRAQRAGITVVIGMLVLGGCAASPEAEDSSTGKSALSGSLQTALSEVLEQTMAEFDVPGAAAGVWMPGEGVWAAAAGTADLDADLPTSIDMSWPLRSVTKSYTVTLLLQLVDEGEVSLDDTIGDYVDGVINGDRITLRQLAGMSSGNADYVAGLFPDYLEDPSRIFTLDELNGYMLGQPAQFEPGAEHVYTNANTNLLGAVVEAVTGQQFAQVLDERILAPLGLSDTHYLVDVAEWNDPHPAGYGPAEDPRSPVPQNFSIFGPAGSMVSTLEDSRVWVEALASGALLEPATQQEREQGAPLDAGPPYDIYALGMGETRGWWGHNGEGRGFTAATFHNPDSGATIVVFTNESDLADKSHPADQAFRRMAALVDAESSK